jgi:predicted GH43/DUF377 family glycosyl hydrolase
MTATVTTTETGIDLRPDPSRVITRYFEPGREDVGPGGSRAAPVIERLLDLDEDAVETAMRDIDERFLHRHRALHDTFDQHAQLVVSQIEPTVRLSPSRRLLLGASFTHEFAVEAAALCNPSVVMDPIQDGSGDAALVFSVRGIGEGHRSSIGFRTGTITADGTVAVDRAGPFPQSAAATPGLPRHEVSSSYRVSFPPSTHLSERVLWPQARAEMQGMEDARFVRFVDPQGGVTYYATYTAFDGVDVSQHLLQTDDFMSFDVSPVAGRSATGKGLALFPRMIDGRFAALSRSDRETNAVAFSDDLRWWDTAHTIQVPERSWEILQLGNCGSPIETRAGWLVLTHGVGAMRTYSLGALLLDLDDPRRVLARSHEPIVSPGIDRREGYVPNVVYSCGAVAHGDTLVLPYGVGDQTISVATLSIEQLLGSLRPEL